MGYSQAARDGIEAQGEAIYARIRPTVEAGNAGKFVVMDLLTGDYEIDAEDLDATKRLIARRPDGVYYGVRIGHAAAYRLGGNRAAGHE